MASALSTLDGKEDIAVSDSELTRLTQFVREQAGIVLQDHQIGNLRDAVSDACHHFALGSTADFIARLRSLPSDAPEREFLISRVTIGESYFFRDEGQIAFLRDTWLPLAIKQKRKTRDLSLRIWCAGCSNGQEPYTVAMLIQDALPDLADWDVNILATDINADALRAAIAARYSDWSFRATPASVRDKFFTRDGKDYVLNDATRNLVSVSYLNLATDSFPSLINHTTNLDMILCRNVFIYFDRPTVAHIVKKFTSCLVMDGHLVVGASDPVSLENEGLVYTHQENAGYFRRADTPPPQPVASLPRPAARSKPASTPAPTPAQPSPSNDELFGAIRRADWATALSIIEAMEKAGNDSPDLTRSKSKVLANMGRLDDAIVVCEALTQGNGTDKHNHFMLGLVRLDTGDVSGAEMAFRGAIFLDRSFMEAHHQLGMTLIRKGRLDKGLASLRNALALAEAAPPDRFLHESGGMTMDRMVDVLRHSIDLYGRH